MRKTLSILLAAVTLPLGLARAEEAPAVETQPAAPVAYPYDTAMPIEPAQLQAPAMPPHAMPQMPVAPMAPMMPPPGTMPMQPGYAPPMPMYAPPPAPPIYLPPGYWVPAPGYYPPPQRPMFRPPMLQHQHPPMVRRVVRRVVCRGGSCRLNRPDRARFFSIGGRFSVLGVNQEIGDKKVDLLGGGFELRLRTRGHFGVEFSTDFLKGSFELNGPVVRESVPMSLSAMLYIFPNRDDRRFNVYFLGGLGYVPTTMTLTDPSGQQVKQDFAEWEAHLGLGAELRFRWFALRADVRGLSLWRDEKTGAAPLYADVDGAPVPSRTLGLQGTLGAAFWF